MRYGDKNESEKERCGESIVMTDIEGFVLEEVPYFTAVLRLSIAHGSHWRKGSHNSGNRLSNNAVQNFSSQRYMLE